MISKPTQNRPWRCRQAGQCFRAGTAGLARNALAALVVAGLWLGTPPFAAAQPVTFDFDSGVPALTAFLPLPIYQTAGGITARFSPISGGYSLQTDGTLPYHLSQFSGKYLWPTTKRGSALRIEFSQELTDIELTFATTDYAPTQPASVVLTALSATANGTNTVGTASSRAAYGEDTYPMGTLAFSMGSTTFNRVEIRIQAGYDSTFFVDNVVATPLPELGIWAADASTAVVFWPAPSAGFVLQQNSTLDPIGWMDVTNTVEVVDGQNQVTVPSATGNGFYRLFHP